MRMLLLLALALGQASASVLTFDGMACSTIPDGSGAVVLCMDGLTYNQVYGDTGGLTFSYSGDISSLGTFAATGTDGAKYIGNASSLIGSNTLYHASIDVTPTSGGTVQLNSLDLTASSGVNRYTAVLVRDPTTLAALFQYGLQSQAPNVTVTLNPNLTSADGYLIDYFDTQQLNGLDNLNVSLATDLGLQSVPEGSTLAFVGLGLAVALLRRKPS